MTTDEIPLTDEQLPVLPDFRLVAIDETADWEKEFCKEHNIETIMGVWLYDDSSRTYCCEMTPSYELTRVETHIVWAEGSPQAGDEPGAEKARDEAYAEVDDATVNISFMYVHCSDIEQSIEAHPDRHVQYGSGLDSDGEEAWLYGDGMDEDELFNDVLEAVQSTQML